MNKDHLKDAISVMNAAITVCVGHTGVLPKKPSDQRSEQERWDQFKREQSIKDQAQEVKRALRKARR